MFSSGTYNRYLFEIDSTQRKMHDTYSRLTGQIQDAAVRKVMEEFITQIEAEQKTLDGIRIVVQGVG